MHHHSSLFSGLVLLALCAQVRAQTPRAFEQAAMLSYDAKDYYAAYKYYDRVLEMEPNRADIALRCAESAALYGALAEAERYYDTALKSGTLTSSKRPVALSGMAQIKKNLGKYEEAIQLFEQYLSISGISDTQKQLIQTEIANCEWAMEKLTNVDQLVQVQRFEAPLNSAESEMGMLKLGTTYYYGGLYPIEWGDRHRPARPLLQVMEAENGRNPRPAWFNQPKKHTALPAFSPDGTLLILPVGTYTSGMEVRCELYLFRQSFGTWSDPIRLPDYINQKGSTQTHPYIVDREDGYLDLFYISDAPGGQGGKDIWSVKFSRQGVFDYPQNLKTLNTPGDEASPFFDPSSQSLYFSSTGYLHLGGFDVYRSEWQSDQWSAPFHLPTPINSSHHDLFYRPLNDSEGLLTSNRLGAVATGDESCCYDLFQVTIQPQHFIPFAQDAITGRPISNAHFELSNKRQSLTWKVGEPLQPLLVRNQNYVLTTSSPGYYSDTTWVSTLDQEKYPSELHQKVALRPLPVEVVVEVYDAYTHLPLGEAGFAPLPGQPSPFGLLYPKDSSSQSVVVKLEPYSSYGLLVEKEGYTSDTLFLSAEQLSSPGSRFVQSVFLEPVNLQHFLPLALFFDNDAPKPAAASRITPYDRTFDAYYLQKEAYVRELAAAFTEPEDQDCAVERLESFFEQEVKAGYLRLEDFAENLDLFLKNDYVVEILIKGFASPLASREYNLALTKRRVQSVKNYLRLVKDGMYNKYLVNRRLIITLAPMGETSVGNAVSDNHRKKHESVYSVEASRERRAEIIEVRLSKIFPSPDNQISE